MNHTAFIGAGMVPSVILTDDRHWKVPLVHVGWSCWWWIAAPGDNVQRRYVVACDKGPRWVEAHGS